MSSKSEIEKGFKAQFIQEIARLNVSRIIKNTNITNNIFDDAVDLLNVASQVAYEKALKFVKSTKGRNKLLWMNGEIKKIRMEIKSIKKKLLRCSRKYRPDLAVFIEITERNYGNAIRSTKSAS